MMLRRLLAFVASAELILGGATLQAQTMTLYSAPGGPSPIFEPVHVPVSCWALVPGDGWTLNFMDLRLYSQGQDLGSIFRVDYYDIEGLLSADVEVGQTDRSVGCSLSSGWGQDQVSILLQRRYPDDLEVLETTGTTFGWGNYAYRRWRRVMDNYGKAYTYAGTPVTEGYYISPDQNECNLVGIVTGAYSLASDAKFPDDYTTFGQQIPWCAVYPAPANCHTNSLQTINVEGSYMFVHDVDWRCSGVDIGG